MLRRNVIFYGEMGQEAKKASSGPKVDSLGFAKGGTEDARRHRGTEDQ